MSDSRIQSQIVSGNFFPSEDFANGKLQDDRYEIYVNNDFVGYKILLNQSDSIEDVDDFLKQQGIKEFSGQLDGDHYYIQTNDANTVKDMLGVYCHNR
ncbi:hypothetical protein [Robertmurraya korlensis]|uniref:hypothetical protein n=1 Tax=Robertmurraya korlensis TaxID=519977 RepID=UPI0008243323|nr:hypothetical protein [Robertmurraya korlensis]